MRGPVHVVQDAAFNLVDDLDHRAVGRHQRQPGPAVADPRADPEHGVGDLVAVVDVVEQPAGATGAAYRGARLLQAAAAGRSWSGGRFAHSWPTSVASISALAVCLRFSACSQTIEQGDSKTAVVTSLPFTAGRSCMKIAVSAARRISASFTW